MTDHAVLRGLILNGQLQTLDTNLMICPAEYFCLKSWVDGSMNITQDTVAIHHFCNSWSGDKTLSKYKFFWGDNKFAERAWKCRKLLLKMINKYFSIRF